MDGRALFAAAVFLTGLGLILVLQQVGAPEGLTRGLGPLFALGTAAVIGVLARTSRVTRFLAASRATSPLYAALAFAGAGAGLIAATEPGLGGAAGAPPGGVLGGLALSALIVGPLLRSSGAASFGDFLVTRFPGRRAGVAIAIGLFVCAGLQAIVGFDLALESWLQATNMGRGFSAALLAALVIAAIAPGGLASVVWSSAACAAGILLMAALNLAVTIVAGGALREIATQAAGAAPGFLAPSASVWTDFACALGVACLAPLASPAIASQTANRARRAGLLALGALALMLFAAFSMRASPAASAAGKGFVSAAQGLAGFALAATASFTAARAWGIDLGSSYRGFAELASTRLARIRLALILVVGGAAGVAMQRAIDPAQAILLAAAITLALIAPALALAYWPRAQTKHIGVAAGVGLLILCLALVAANGAAADAQILPAAFVAGLCGLCAGWIASLLPQPGPQKPSVEWRDRFIDAPLSRWD